MILRIDIDVEQVTDGVAVPAAVLAERAVEAINQVSFPVRGITHAVRNTKLVYNAGADPNAPEEWKTR